MGKSPGWQSGMDFVVPGDQFRGDGPDQQVIDDYNAGKYNGQQPVGGYAPNTGMPGMTDPSGMDGGLAYNPCSGGALAVGGPGTGSPYGVPSSVSMAGMGLDYGNASLADTMAKYRAEPEPNTGGASNGGGGGVWGDMSGGEKNALASQGG